MNKFHSQNCPKATKLSYLWSDSAGVFRPGTKKKGFKRAYGKYPQPIFRKFDSNEVHVSKTLEYK